MCATAHIGSTNAKTFRFFIYSIRTQTWSRTWTWARTWARSRRLAWPPAWPQKRHGHEYGHGHEYEHGNGHRLISDLVMNTEAHIDTDTDIDIIMHGHSHGERTCGHLGSDTFKYMVAIPATDSDVTISVSISIHRTSILRTSNCITGMNENKCNIYNHFVKSSTFVSGIPIVRNCAHTHTFSSTVPNFFKLQAVDIGPKMSKIYDGDEKSSIPSTLGRRRVNKTPLVCSTVLWLVRLLFLIANIMLSHWVMTECYQNR